jgi:arginyl-tRNA synthetase
VNGVKRLIVKQKLAEAITQAIIKAQDDNVFQAVDLPEIIMERPQKPEYGDYASSLPLKLASALSLAPVVIAKKIVDYMPQLPEIARINVAAPGFINFTLNPAWLAQQVESILSAGDAYGAIDIGNNRSVQLEFVSGNPTGPLHIGHGRGAVLGSTLASVLARAGFQVKKEYYINDAGSQLDAFNRSLYVRYQQGLGRDVSMPDDGYMGSYMVDLAQEIIGSEGKRFLDSDDDDVVQKLGSLGMQKMIETIKDGLKALGVEYDSWFSEQELYKSGLFDRVMEILQDSGHVAGRDDAVWFVSSALGEDKDNVLIRSDSSPTYFASDIAYHYNKFVERHFDRVIDIWGADHQGHVSRMKAVLGALSIDPERLKILIYQLVTLRRGNNIVKVSKRSGDMITLSEVIDEVGLDACRFVFLSRSADSQMDFDMELAKKQSADNPVYYVQYAHARIASIVRVADERGVGYKEGDVSLLSSEPELALIRQMITLPEIVELIADTLEPQYLPYYAKDLATAFHSFYKQCRVISRNSELSAARLKLVKAAMIVLANTLHLMGMNAPEHM